MNDVQMEMPKYRSHKTVHALKIAAAEVNKDGLVTSGWRVALAERQSD